MSQAQELLDALPQGTPANLSSAEAACAIADHIAKLPHTGTPPIAGINGAQGSGKSTLTQLIAAALRLFHSMQAVSLSLDDFYLGKPQRLELGRNIHPLCITRGVPGTHDLPLMLNTFADLRGAAPESITPLPSFDKLADDRLPREEWESFTGRPDVILFEGWCVGLDAIDVPAWKGPINRLETDEDPDGVWFHWSYSALAHDYADAWSQINLLVSIEVPDIATVIDSRLLQEDGLAQGSDRPRMDRAAVTRFVEHYERYTRALWQAMPRRADILLRRGDKFGYELLHG